MIQLHSNTKFKLIFIVKEAVNGPLPLLAEEIQDVFRSGEEEDLLLSGLVKNCLLALADSSGGHH